MVSCNGASAAVETRVSLARSGAQASLGGPLEDSLQHWQNLDTLSLQQCKSRCYTAGENPWGQRESEREHPELIVATLEGKPQILLMMNSD